MIQFSVSDLCYFGKSVKVSVLQIRRLMHRPSILLWAGSNENEKALRQNW